MRLPLEGERVTLRSLRSEDALDVFAYASDPEVTRFVGWQTHSTPIDSLAYIQGCLQPSAELFTFAVAHRAQGQVIGTVDLRLISRMRRIGEIGYTIARSHWGQGFNVEAGSLLLDFAFGELALRRVIAVCDVRNHRSYRTMEKLGMLREHLLKGNATPGGPTADRYQYSILYHEWRRLRAGAVPLALPTGNPATIQPAAPV